MKKSTLISLCLLILVAILFGYFMGYPTYEDWQAQVTKRKGLDLIIDRLEANVKASQQLESASATIKEKSDASLALIPEKEDRESFLNQFDQLAKTHGVSLSVFNFSVASVKPKPVAGEEDTESKSTKSDTTKTKKTATSAVNFNATILGEYGSVKNFLVALRTLSRFATIGKITVAQGEGTQVLLTLEGSIYSQPLPKNGQLFPINESLWAFLNRSATPTQLTGGRANPFAAY